MDKQHVHVGRLNAAGELYIYNGLGGYVILRFSTPTGGSDPPIADRHIVEMPLSGDGYWKTVNGFTIKDPNIVAGGVEFTLEATNHFASGIKMQFSAGDTFHFGDAAYVDSLGVARIANRSAKATANACLLCIEPTLGAGSRGYFLVEGVACFTGWNFTTGGDKLIYLSALGTTFNTLTQDDPNGYPSGHVIQVLGQPIQSNIIKFRPSLAQAVRK